MLDATCGVVLRSEVASRARGEAHGLFSTAGAGKFDRHVAAVAKARDHLGCALTSDAQFPTDLGDRDVGRAGADVQDTTIGEASVVEAGGCHLLIQPTLIADPGTSKGSAEPDSFRDVSAIPVRAHCTVGLCPAGGPTSVRPTLTTMVD